jgi:hypothetical protein
MQLTSGLVGRCSVFGSAQKLEQIHIPTIAIPICTNMLELTDGADFQGTPTERKSLSFELQVYCSLRCCLTSNFQVETAHWGVRPTNAPQRVARQRISSIFKCNQSCATIFCELEIGYDKTFLAD